MSFIAGLLLPKTQVYFWASNKTGPNFIIKNLPSVLILIIADKLL